MFPSLAPCMSHEQQRLIYYYKFQSHTTIVVNIPKLTQTYYMFRYDRSGTIKRHMPSNRKIF
jgi:hypothetical protein